MDRSIDGYWIGGTLRHTTDAAGVGDDGALPCRIAQKNCTYS